MKNNHPHGGHRARMRKKFIQDGLSGFHDHEALEMLLYYAYPRCDTNEIAHRFLREFGSLHNLLETDTKTLMQKLKCSENVAVLLSLLPGIMNRAGRSKWGKQPVLDHVEAAAEYVSDLLAGYTVEHFYVLCLDKRYRLLHCAHISKGTLDATAVYPREVTSAVLANNAAYVILAHNHPAGSTKPSSADLQLTRDTVEMLSKLFVPVIDHVIAAGDTYYSFAARRQFVRGY
jgi:DNA repair protein RadC